jgi:5-formyltetrahydrofolate cyclo-ligase
VVAGKLHGIIAPGVFNVLGETGLSLSMTKAQLRKIYLTKRLSVSEVEQAELSLSICNNFFDQIELRGVNIIHTFLPLEKKKEVDTWKIIHEIIQKWPDIRISVPKVNLQTGSLQSFFLEDAAQLVHTAWGIAEPQYGIETNPSEIDVVIVPMLVCDRRGHRVGYGKGFYDRFLSTCRPACRRVGISFFEPIDEIDDVNGYDIPLHYCITPLNVHKFTPTAPAD